MKNVMTKGDMILFLIATMSAFVVNEINQFIGFTIGVVYCIIVVIYIFKMRDIK